MTSISTPHLILLSNQHPIQLEDLTLLGQNLLSYLPGSNLKINERHARIERRDHGYILRDLKTADGTYLNETRIIEAILQDGDCIRVGEIELKYQSTTTPSKAQDEIQTKHPLWSEQLSRLSDIARTHLPILITGESGTGKDVLAKKIHELSLRASGPFYSVNCGAFTDSLIESELFGHIRGSYTGALEDRKGAFESARNGTLFLDEIGDLPLSIQPKLLRVLENQEIRPLGSDQIISTNVRILAATHQDLRQKVRRGQFRLDLYYRLNVMKFNTPPLRNRMEDFDAFLFRFAKDQKVRFSHEAILQLKEHHWPGNIRELKNVVARASVLFGKHTVHANDIELLIEREPLSPLPTAHLLETTPCTSNMSVVKEIEREMIIERLIANRGNQRRTAADLKIPKSTLHDRIKAYNINIDELTSA